MTDKDKLITVSFGTNILQEMQLMTGKRIRHVSVIDQKDVGMTSIVNVVRRCSGKGCSGWCAGTGKVQREIRMGGGGL